MCHIHSQDILLDQCRGLLTPYNILRLGIGRWFAILGKKATRHPVQICIYFIAHAQMLKIVMMSDSSDTHFILCIFFFLFYIIKQILHRYSGELKKFDLRSGFKRHRHFVGFFNVPAQAPTRGKPFYGYSEKPPHFRRLFYDVNDTEDLFSSPRVMGNI